MYTEQFFRSYRWSSNRKNPQSYSITQDMINKIKTLVAYKSNQSGYYDNMLQWRSEDNEHLNDKELNSLYPAMQLITMTCKVNDDFIKKYDVQDWQIGLLKELYLDWDDDCITMAFKRPFGNSDVLGDVREEMVRHGVQTAINKENNDSDDYYEEGIGLNQFIDMLQKLFQEGAYHLPITSFNQVDSASNGSFSYDPNQTQWPKYLDLKFRLHSYLYDWEPSLQHQRDEKLNILLSN